MSERYIRGIEIAERLAPEKLDQFATSRVAELAPDFARMAIEFPLGDLYARDNLDLRSREIVALASLATLGNASPQLRIHIRAAAQVGLSREEIIEILMQTAIYAGFPSALNAISSSHDILAEENIRHAARRVAGQG